MRLARVCSSRGLSICLSFCLVRLRAVWSVESFIWAQCLHPDGHLAEVFSRFLGHTEGCATQEPVCRQVWKQVASMRVQSVYTDEHAYARSAPVVRSSSLSAQVSSIEPLVVFYMFVQTNIRYKVPTYIYAYTWIYRRPYMYLYMYAYTYVRTRYVWRVYEHTKLYARSCVYIYICIYAE